MGDPMASAQMPVGSGSLKQKRLRAAKIAREYDDLKPKRKKRKPKQAGKCRTWLDGIQCTNPLTTKSFCKAHGPKLLRGRKATDFLPSNGRGSMKSRMKKLRL